MLTRHITSSKENDHCLLQRHCDRIIGDCYLLLHPETLIIHPETAITEACTFFPGGKMLAFIAGPFDQTVNQSWARFQLFNLQFVVCGYDRGSMQLAIELRLNE